MDTKQSKRHAPGFTLVELMMTLALVAIIVSLAAPPLRELVINNRAQSSADELLSMMQYTRSEAIKRNTAVTACKVDPDDSEACSSDAADGWHQGLLVFIDADADSVVEDPAQILQAREAMGGDLSVSANADSVTYRPNGASANGADFSVCTPDGDKDKSRNIAISATGRPRLYKGSVGSLCPDV
jgi:type IV fimbrial biogenesis protein FimT